MLVSPGKSGLDSLFKEVRVFKGLGGGLSEYGSVAHSVERPTRQPQSEQYWETLSYSGKRYARKPQASSFFAPSSARACKSAQARLSVANNFRRLLCEPPKNVYVGHF